MKMMKRILPLALCAALLLCLAACGGSPTLALTVTNDLGADITELYIFPSSSGDTGNSLVRTLSAGASTSLQLDEYAESGTLDIWVGDEYGDVYSFERVTVSDGAKVELFSDGYDAVVFVTPEKGNETSVVGDIIYHELTPEEMPLPATGDELNMQIALPSYSPELQIYYPDTLKVFYEGERQLQLDAANGLDEPAGIVVSLVEIADYDSYFTSGDTKAKEGLQKLMSGVLDITVGSANIASTIGEDFQNGGDYYALTSFTWLSGKVFADSADTPVRGATEIRYYGPTGYLLVIHTTSVESRVADYYGIAKEMMNAIDFGGSWDTTPVATAPPVNNSGGSAPPKPWWSDPGDYGIQYDYEGYWVNGQYYYYDDYYDYDYFYDYYDYYGYYYDYYGYYDDYYGYYDDYYGYYYDYYGYYDDYYDYYYDDYYGDYNDYYGYDDYYGYYDDYYDYY